MSKLADIFEQAIGDWIAQGRSEEQIHGVRNFFSGRGEQLKPAIKDLMLELIGEDETPRQHDKALEEIIGAPQMLLNTDIVFHNQLRGELRQKVKEL